MKQTHNLQQLKERLTIKRKFRSTTASGKRTFRGRTMKLRRNFLSALLRSSEKKSKPDNCYVVENKIFKRDYVKKRKEKSNTIKKSACFKLLCPVLTILFHKIMPFAATLNCSSNQASNGACRVHAIKWLKAGGMLEKFPSMQSEGEKGTFQVLYHIREIFPEYVLQLPYWCLFCC